MGSRAYGKTQLEINDGIILVLVATAVKPNFLERFNRHSYVSNDPSRFLDKAQGETYVDVDQD